MRSRRLACLILGLWLGGGLLMAWVTAESSRSVDRLLSQPNPLAAVETRNAGRAPITELMRYQAAELSRAYRETWEWAQLCLGAFFFFFLLFGTTQGKASLALALLLFLVVAAQRLLLTPQIAAMGRSLDFAASAASVDRNQLRVLRYGYTLTELAKLMLGLTLAGLLTWQRSGRSLDAGQQVNAVDKANHRHVDR